VGVGEALNPPEAREVPERALGEACGSCGGMGLQPLLPSRLFSGRFQAVSSQSGATRDWGADADGGTGAHRTAGVRSRPSAYTAANKIACLDPKPQGKVRVPVLWAPAASRFPSTVPGSAGHAVSLAGRKGQREARTVKPTEEINTTSKASEP
jgi:hypothetical protein